ncbi:peptidylprolyl isomerase [Mesonia hippocampi]|uniref:Peptidyl-prolyl cis-trans isomerase n=1 Tax=Mesonia hippocampi TaxID=1628250 RepID=A0A840EUJ0_9FLAO|nr:peptidylprolyl isomerase [Mesonia hippocampi]MBB4119136.1 peptidylprolyl isomerase [Mesonia hippocampi]
MSLKKSVLSGLLLSFCFACQDTKTTPTKAPKKSTLTTQQDSLLKAIVIPSGGEKTEMDLSNITPITQEELIPFLTAYGEKNPEQKVLISTDYGDIEITLFNNAPLHRANFIRLVKLNYFNTTFFHRVAAGFVVQGGNSDTFTTPKNRKAVGDYLIPNEFSSKHPHTYGAFSAAKYSEQNISKASSPFEFFIVVDKTGAHHLDNEHTVFGKVTKGMDVALKIAKAPVDEREWPIENITMDIEIVN